jgi:hypothetical protein
MRNILMLTTFGALAFLQTAPDNQPPSGYQPLGVNTGLWTTKMVITQSGQAAIPDEALARLTPEQRAKAQASLQARLNGQPITRTSQSCLTADQIKNGSVFNPDKQQCTEKLLNSSATSVEFTVNCQEPSVQTSTHLTLTASDPGDVTGTGTTTVIVNGRTMTSNAQFTAKWLSASCPSSK